MQTNLVIGSDGFIGTPFCKFLEARGEKVIRFDVKRGKKEDARFVLPEATTTELVVTGNFQAWLDFIALRADTHAQWEIRNVAKTINNILAKELDNNLFTWMP